MDQKNNDSKRKKIEIYDIEQISQRRSSEEFQEYLRKLFNNNNQDFNYYWYFSRIKRKKQTRSGY